MFRPLTPTQIGVDVGIAVLCFVAIASVEMPSGLLSGGGGGVPVALLLAGALAVRRLAPGLALGIAWFGAIVQMFLLLTPRVSDLLIFAVLYATAAYGSRLVFWAGFASAIGGAVVITGYLVFVGTTVAVGTVPTALAVLAAALFALLLSWVSGALVRVALRVRESRLATQRARAETVAEQERVRIARDMHDVVAHSLAVVIAQADGARYAAASDPSAASVALGTISTTARGALADVRLLLTQLRQAPAPAEGDSPQPTLGDLEALYAQVRAAGIALRVEVDPAPPPNVPGAVQLAVFRVLQEALTNAIRHGDGGVVDVRLAWSGDRVELSVRNGVPVSVAARPGHDSGEVGHGLIGMRERAQLAGGTMDAGFDESGYVVHAVLPVGFSE